MSIKHALVVDDSRSAQAALKKQLEQHELRVSLADSGEQALEFLEHQHVDVIFMDHTMPGMDGLEALAAIKRNPRTAMIPVMMYTTKEGEVYVGQARALGGIGVLPKEVHPQVLFEMLQKLGLVRDKRAPGPSEPDTPRRRATDAVEPDAAPAVPSNGMAIAALVSRISEDQAVLRADLRRDRAGFAREVANEVLEAQRTVPSIPEAAPPVATPMAAGQRLLVMATALLAATTFVLALLAWDALRGSTDTAAQPGAAAAMQTQIDGLDASLRDVQDQARVRYLKAIDALQWALNQRATSAFDELPFDDARADQLRDLLERLVALGFRGRVRMESHLGEFCLVDDAGSYQLAPPDLPVEACAMIGHPLDNSADVGDRQSVGFADFMRNSPLVTGSGIVVELVARDRAHSMRQTSFATDIARAGDWNRVAERNERVQFTLVSSD